MFGFFKKKKSELDQMKERYETLQEEAYKLSHTDREASVKKTGEAEALWAKIEEISKQSK
jgi:hypothetical protein